MPAVIAYGGSQGDYVFDKYLPRLLELASNGYAIGISMLAKTNAVRDGVKLQPEIAPSERIRQLLVKNPALQHHPHIKLLDENSTEQDFAACDIFVDQGGSVEWLSCRLVENMGVNSPAYLDGKILIVDSAASAILFEHGYADNLQDLVRGVGLFPGLMIPHFEEHFEHDRESTGEVWRNLQEQGYPESIWTMNEDTKFVWVDPRDMDVRMMTAFRYLYPKRERQEGELAIYPFSKVK